MHYERGDRPPLNKQERFILNALSSGLRGEELLQRIEKVKKSPDSIFPQYYGPGSLGLSLRGLIEKGMVKELPESSNQGQKVPEEEKIYIVRTPAPDVRPYPRRAEPARPESPKPTPQVRPVEHAKIVQSPKPIDPQPKKKLKEEKLTLEELGKRRNEFRPG